MSLGHGAQIVKDGLVLHLDAANKKSYPGSGTTWSDLSGNGNDGTLVNGVGYDSANNGSMVFDGVNDLTTGTLPFTGNVSSFSVSVWTKAISRNGTYSGIIQLDGTDTNGHVGGIIISFSGSDTALRIRHWNDGGTNYSWTSNPIGNWKNFVLVVSDNQIKGYDNTRNVVDSSFTNGFDFSGNYRIGQYTYLTNYYEGLTSNVQVYNRALSEAEIQQNFEALRGRYGI